jgi:hypothetical protein
MARVYAHIIQATIVGSLHGSETNNVLHFGTNLDPFVPADLAADLFAFANASLNDAISGEQNIVQVRIRQLTPVITDAQDFFPAAPIKGPDFTPALPSFNAVLVSMKTGLGGRSFRGRIFFPGVQKNDADQSVLTSGGVTKWQAVVDELVSRYIPDPEPAAVKSWNLGVWSIFNNKIKRPAPVFTTANLLILRSIIATMHSRKKGVGS